MYEQLQVGKWYAEMDDESGAPGVLYQCIAHEGEHYVMVDESDDTDPRYISGRSATTEFWVKQL